MSTLPTFAPNTRRWGSFFILTKHALPWYGDWLVNQSKQRNLEINDSSTVKEVP